MGSGWAVGPRGERPEGEREERKKKAGGLRPNWEFSKVKTKINTKTKTKAKIHTKTKTKTKNETNKLQEVEKLFNSIPCSVFLFSG